MISISNFENYVVLETGQIINTRTGRTLKPYLNENGYLYVTLWNGKIKKQRTVHRLVAEAYIANPGNKPTVKHIDADRTNPHRNNLEWCTQSRSIPHSQQAVKHVRKYDFAARAMDVVLSRLRNIWHAKESPLAKNRGRTAL